MLLVFSLHHELIANNVYTQHSQNDCMTATIIKQEKKYNFIKRQALSPSLRHQTQEKSKINM